MKGFQFSSFIKAKESDLSDSYIVYGGNFIMEIVLPNAFKISSFSKLRDKVHNFMKTHGGKVPERILANKRQIQEYKEFFTRNIGILQPQEHYADIKFNGIPIIKHGR